MGCGQRCAFLAERSCYARQRGPCASTRRVGQTSSRIRPGMALRLQRSPELGLALLRPGSVHEHTRRDRAGHHVVKAMGSNGNRNGNGSGHSHEQGLRVHHLANLGGLIALAGLDLEPPDFLLGTLLSVAEEAGKLTAAQRSYIASIGRKKLDERATGKRAWKSWR